jgi:hypothetical protein
VEINATNYTCVTIVISFDELLSIINLNMMVWLLKERYKRLGTNQQIQHKQEIQLNDYKTYHQQNSYSELPTKRV